MNKRYKLGISLIVLVITLIVIIILAGAIISSLSSNNPILQATKVVFLSDVSNFKTELELYKASQFLYQYGRYNPISLQADTVSVTYNEIIDTTKTINDLVPSLVKAIKYDGQFAVIDGELVYQGLDSNMQIWANESGMQVINPGAPKVTIIPPTDTVVAPGTDVVYTIKFSSNAALTTIDLTGKVEVLDNAGVTLISQPVITIGTISGTSADSARQVDVTIATNTLTNGTYKLKVKAGSVTNINDISNTLDTISLTGFDIDTNPPTNPIMSANPTLVTSGDVVITITYSADTVTKEYSLDGTHWSTYTIPFFVTTNDTTVYAIGRDALLNIIGVSAITILNIDKDLPTVTYGTNGATNVQTASTMVTIDDVGISGLDESTLQYVWDMQNTTAPISGWASFTNNQTLTKSGVTGTYYLWVKASDNVGNIVTSKTNAFITDNTPPTIVYGTNGAADELQVSTTVTVSDIGSGINASSLQYIWDTQNTVAPSSGWTAFTNGANLTKTGDGTYYLWIKALDNVGNLVTEKSNVFTIGDVVIIVSTVQTENKTFAGATTGFSYNNPVIPAGFVAVNTTDASWDNLSTVWDKGLVIQDTSGNQFVWVPVDGTNVRYEKWCTEGVAYNDPAIGETTLPPGFSYNNITITYKGFYIARYEAMFDYNGGNIRVASKKSTNKATSYWVKDSEHTGYLWNFMDYEPSKTYSENMDTSYGYDTTKVGTNLITGAEWDTVMKWIQNSGKSVTDSRTWGNYADSTSVANIPGFSGLQISGFSNYWKAKNIYDLAGNTWEWTNEIYRTDIVDEHVNRGGGYNDSGIYDSASFRNNHNASGIGNFISFRTSLYVL